MFIRHFTTRLLAPKDDEILVDAGGTDNVSFIEDGDNTVIDLSPQKKDLPAANVTSATPQQDPALLNTLNDIRNRLSQQQQPQEDPTKAEWEALNDQERALAVQWETLKASKQLTDDKLTEFDKKSKEIIQKRSDISAQRALRNMLPQILGAQNAQSYRNEYADVYANPRAELFAKGTYDQLRAEGHADSPLLVKRAMNAARIKFGMSGSDNGPTENDKRQLSGVNGGGTRPMKDNTIKMGKAEKSMALSMYGKRFNGDEKKAFKAWAEGPGLSAKREAEKLKGTDRLT